MAARGRDFTCYIIRRQRLTSSSSTITSRLPPQNRTLVISFSSMLIRSSMVFHFSCLASKTAVISWMQYSDSDKGRESKTPAHHDKFGHSIPLGDHCCVAFPAYLAWKLVYLRFEVFEKTEQNHILDGGADQNDWQTPPCSAA